MEEYLACSVFDGGRLTFPYSPSLNSYQQVTQKLFATWAASCSRQACGNHVYVHTNAVMEQEHGDAAPDRMGLFALSSCHSIAASK